jgi:hypothetical protein
MAVTVCALSAAAFIWTASARRVARPSAVKSAPVPVGGTDTLLVLFLSSTCPACRAEPYASALRDALAKYNALGQHSRVIGVAIDADAQIGVEYLSTVASFDQVSAGAGWINQLANAFIWSDSVPIASVPQLLVIRRRTTLRGERYVAVSDSIVERALGLPPIVQWLNDQLRPTHK